MTYNLKQVPIRGVQYGNILDSRHGGADLHAGDGVDQLRLLEARGEVQLRGV